MSEFKNSVIKVCQKIPKGKLVSYGQVAAMVGSPRSARQVGWILNKLPSNSNVPWWRIINNKGYISIKGSYMNAEDQKSLIENEGIDVTDDYEIDIEKCRWRPSIAELKKLELDSEYLGYVVDKYGL